MGSDKNKVSLIMMLLIRRLTFLNLQTKPLDVVTQCFFLPCFHTASYFFSAKLRVLVDEASTDSTKDPCVFFTQPPHTHTPPKSSSLSAGSLISCWVLRVRQLIGSCLKGER